MLKEFDFLVLGNEPAGLWLLQRLSRSLHNRSSPSQVAWVKTNQPIPKQAIASPYAKYFGIYPHEKWSAEVISQNRSTVWSAGGLTERLAQCNLELPTGSVNPNQTIEPKQQKKLTQLLKHWPEFLSYSAGFWKALGRSETLSALNLCQHALHHHELFWWDPAKRIPADVHQITGWSATHSPLKRITRRRGVFQIEFSDETSVFCQHLILNVSLAQLFALQRTLSDFQITSLSASAQAKTACYPLQITYQPNTVPKTARPITLYFDTDYLPNPATEIWPYFHDVASRTLTGWVQSAWPVCLDALTEQFCQATQRAYQLFPFLRDRVEQFSFPLSLNSCHSPSARNQFLQEAELFAKEKFRLMGTSAKTRIPSFYHLSPALNAHLPSGLGPLSAAKSLLGELLPRARSSKKAKTTSPPSKPLGNAP